MKRMRLFSIPVSLCAILIAFTLSNCSKDDPQPATTGKIGGKVTALATGAALLEATVIAFDAGNNAPVGITKTNNSGDYSMDVPEGNYFLKFYKQGYESVPPAGIQPVPFSVTIGQTASQSAEMSPSLLANAGSISGKVSVGTTAQSGVLVIAEGNGSAYSAVSDKDGNFNIFNVPAATYEVKGYAADLSSSIASATVTGNTATNNVSVTLSQGASGSVSGTFKVISQTTIATPPVNMDISLVHPVTKETVPGLSQSLPYSSSLTYSFSNVPDGTYVVRATYANDYIVIDPDYITKFGDYKVTITGGTPDLSSVDIVATSAVLLSTPTNEMSTTVPMETSATPTFQWTAYASTSDYVIEVTDASTGNVVWGGFTNSGGTLTKNITIPSNTTSITFNSDGNAKSELISGKVYRWRIFASKNNVQSGSWNLIAASEDQEGLIKVK
ncbi:MAG: carboxypeptidase regulatory-like domain-containing protein [Cyclobacteriaceae bacterium]